MELSKVKPKTLYIIATPIGNPKDISIRALETLKEVDFILAEDTRTLNDFLRLYGIKEKKIISYYSQNEKQKLSQVLSFFDQGSVALVSEAGTPLISDPGFLLVKACIEKKIAMTCIPGASTLTTLLPLSGFSLKEFFFKGFLSNKRGTRQNQLKKLLEIETVLIIYESPHRILKH
jgi:16S rRNA (cytidine1402-2'-O)-methyltransferase